MPRARGAQGIVAMVTQSVEPWVSSIDIEKRTLPNQQNNQPIIRSLKKLGYASKLEDIMERFSGSLEQMEAAVRKEPLAKSGTSLLQPDELATDIMRSIVRDQLREKGIKPT